MLQGAGPSGWIDSCYTDFDYDLDRNANYDFENPMPPDVNFCRTVHTLNLTISDVEKLGKELNWFNYTMQTALELVDNSQFYEKYGIENTLMIYPSLGMRDVLPPSMATQISFDYKYGGMVMKFDRAFSISPLYTIAVCDNDLTYHECSSRITANFCKDDMSLQFNLHDKPVCVKDSSIMKLAIRGYL